MTHPFPPYRPTYILPTRDSLAKLVKRAYALVVSRPVFQIVRMDNPPGMKPGRYYYVEYTPTGTKVSRYLRRLVVAARKRDRYQSKYFLEGDRYWPEVDRCDELRDSPDAVPTYMEYLRAALNLGCS